MVEILFESHGTTFDNEAHRASGHADVALSPLGEKQSKEMGERYADRHFDAIFCSDLQRSYKSAELAFGEKFPIIRDERLRECDYGEMTRHPSEEVDTEKPKRIREPFPGGESYEQTTQRMRGFLSDLLRDYDGKTVMIIGHRATQYGLEALILGKTLDEVVPAPWKWQPGWMYKLAAVPRPSAGGIVLGTDGKMVLVCQHGNSWSFPKGGMEDGESLVEAARREIREETGLRELELLDELGSYERYSIGKDGTGETKEWGSRKRSFFLFRTGETELRPGDDEVTEARWATFDEAVSMLTHPKDREFLESVRTKIEERL